MQYREVWAITGAIQRTSKEKNYDELGLHSLTSRPWRSKLIFFYKIVHCLLPDYFYSYLHLSDRHYYLNSDHSHHEPYLLKWNNLKACPANAKSLNIFKMFIVSEKEKNSLSWVYDPLSVKILTRLRLEFDHLNERKFRHGFKDTLNLLCTCRADVESTEHFLLYCQ